MAQTTITGDFDVEDVAEATASDDKPLTPEEELCMSIVRNLRQGNLRAAHSAAGDLQVRIQLKIDRR